MDGILGRGLVRERGKEKQVELRRLWLAMVLGSPLKELRSLRRQKKKEN